MTCRQAVQSAFPGCAAVGRGRRGQLGSKPELAPDLSSPTHRGGVIGGIGGRLASISLEEAGWLWRAFCSPRTHGQAAKPNPARTRGPRGAAPPRLDHWTALPSKFATEPPLTLLTSFHSVLSSCSLRPISDPFDDIGGTRGTLMIDERRWMIETIRPMIHRAARSPRSALRSPRGSGFEFGQFGRAVLPAYPTSALRRRQRRTARPGPCVLK